jgi:hypothetical protein
MQTLALQDRDLVINPGSGFLTYTGSRRLQQDLTLALGEDYGNDRFHPRWGSVLVQFVGQPTTSALRHEVEAEVSRVINNYLSVQQDFIAQDMLNAVNSRFTTADIIAEIVSVKSSLAMDAIEILIELRNLDKNTIFVRAGATL